jgi:hypothetical protein
MRPPQFSHFSTSTLNTRDSSSAHGTRDRAREGGVVAGGRGSVEPAQAAGAAGSGCGDGPSGEQSRAQPDAPAPTFARSAE